MSNVAESANRIGQGGLRTEIYLDRSLSHTGNAVRGISKSAKGRQRGGGSGHARGLCDAGTGKYPTALGEAERPEVPRAAAAQNLHPERGWERETDLDPRSGGQDELSQRRRGSWSTPATVRQ